MAQISKLWKDFQDQQKRDAARIAANVVRDAVIQSKPPCNDPRPLQRLHAYAEMKLPDGPTDYQLALLKELERVNNGTL